MAHSHDLAEWAAFLSLGTGIFAAFSAPYYLLVEAECWAWPPLVGRAGDRLLVETVNAKLAALQARDRARLAAVTAALALALRLNAPKGATR